MRIYLNSLDDELPWSIDTGNIGTETKWKAVLVVCPAVTKLDMSKRGSKTEPCAWLECNGVISPLDSSGIAIVK